MGWLVPRRATEATTEQLVASGAAGGYGTDPIDGDRNWRPAGSGGREVPWWSLERARAFGVAGYRLNPMARAILDTYTSFCVGDSGLTLQCPVPEVRAVAEEFWRDPANRLEVDQELMLRELLIMGESADEMMVGPTTGAVRINPIDPCRIEDVAIRDGNPLWPAAILLRRAGADADPRTVVTTDELTGRRSGQVIFERPWRATRFDRRGYPFLGPVLDWLDSYDNVLANLIDRTALARYLVWDVTVNGDQTAVDRFVAQRQSRQAPRSGTVEVHSDGVKWEPKTAEVGAAEDATTAQSVLTSVAAGSGLAKTWLAEPEDANRATSLSMAEPVRRRVGGVQNLWLAHDIEMVRYAVDQAVNVGRLEPWVTLPDGSVIEASRSITITGPEIADSPASVGAEVLVKLSQSLTAMKAAGFLSVEACELASRKGWEDFMGVPWRPELATPEAEVDDVATHLDETGSTANASVLDQLA